MCMLLAAGKLGLHGQDAAGEVLGKQPQPQGPQADSARLHGGTWQLTVGRQCMRRAGGHVMQDAEFDAPR